MPGTQQTILVIDDDEAIREFVSFALTKAYFKVVCAQNGIEGLTMAKAERPDLLITDLVMPEKEGIETIREFKLLFPHCPIIAISGSANSETYLPMAKLLGASKVLPKPFSREEIVGAVTDAMPSKP